MLRRLSVRGKVLAVLAVPVLILFVAASVISLQSINDVREARAVNALLSALQSQRTLTGALQAERAAGVLYLGDMRTARTLAGPANLDEGEADTREFEAGADFAQQYDDAQAATDALAGRILPQFENLALTGLPDTVAAAVARYRQALNELEALRVRADEVTQLPSLIDRDYSEIIRAGMNITSVTAASTSNRELALYLDAFALTELTTELMVNEADLGYFALSVAGEEAGANMALLALFPETISVHTRATAAIEGLLDESITMPPLGASWNGFARWTDHRQALSGGDSRLAFEGSVRPDVFRNAAIAEADELGPTLTNIWRSSTTMANAAEGAALRGAAFTIGITLLVIAASIVVALLISRTIIVPLRKLRDAAGEVRKQLPRIVEQVAVPGQGPDLSLMQIPVESNDEVGALAVAFNEVNATTVEVAQEQAALRGSIAEMFVNVARRDQVLLNRQLSFIDQLERTEEDPNTLADLFRLDHLATRMRRNAESLLVLAGIDSGRRVRDSMTLSDVVRTASSEIEQYDRIALDLPVDPRMHGFNSLPAAHLMAEVLENATVFSEPGTPVEVITGADVEFITVTIIDHGLGMTEDELTNANARIASTSASDVIGAQRLGLHVVGRLARRLGTKVALSKAPGGTGTQTLIRFPRALFVDNAEGVGSVDGLAARDHSPRIPERIPDVPPAPTAVEVDLEALTDGSTPLGLPRRRAGDEPQAPAAATPSGLPARRNIVLPEAVTPRLAPEVARDAEGWAPQVAPSTESALPSRAATGAKASDPDPEAPARVPAASLDPGRRAGMFAGFRRGTESDAADGETPEAETAAAEPAAEAVLVEPDVVGPDVAELAPVADEVPVEGEAPAAVAEGPVSHAAPAPTARPPAPMVVPGLVPDDDAPAAEQVFPPVFAPTFEPSAGQVDEPAQFAAGPVPDVPAAEAGPSVGYPVEQPVGDAPAPAPVGDYPAFDPGSGYSQSLDESRAWFASDNGTGPQPAVAAPSPAAAPAPAAPSPGSWVPEVPAASAPAEALPERGVPAVPAPFAQAGPAPAAEPTPQAPEPQAHPAAFPAVGFPAAPAGDAPAGPSAPSFGDLVGAEDGAPAAKKGKSAKAPKEKKERRGLFSRRKKAEPAQPAPQPTASPASSGFESRPSPVAAARDGQPAPVAPTFASPPAAQSPAWAPQTSDGPLTPAAGPFQPVGGPAAPTAPAPGAADQLPTSQAPPTPVPAAGPSPAGPPGTSFTPGSVGAWTPSTPGTGQVGGALDDDVAAMLALRSDIQEQALAELSQLSAYRPQKLSGSGSLTKRVPTAVPDTTQPDDETESKPIERDADELRSRLSSFQSGAARGRGAELQPPTQEPAPSTDVGVVPAQNGAPHGEPHSADPESTPAPQGRPW